MVEFLVAAAVLVPLVFAIVLVARLQDVRAATNQSARYGAFAQAFTDTTPQALQSEIRSRYFAAATLPVLAEDRVAARRTDSNPHWMDLSRRGNPLVTQPEDVTLLLANVVPPVAAAGGAAAAVAAVDRAARVTGNRFDLERRGYYSANVSVRIADVPVLTEFGAPPITLRSVAHVLGRDWSSTGPAETASRTTALVPSAPLRNVRTLIAPMTWALSLFEPALRGLCLGRVDPELVPADRLGPPGGDDAGTWVAECA